MHVLTCVVTAGLATHAQILAGGQWNIMTLVYHPMSCYLPRSLPVDGLIQAVLSVLFHANGNLQSMTRKPWKIYIACYRGCFLDSDSFVSVRSPRRLSVISLMLQL